MSLFSILQGIFLGFIIVLPGISGGTALMILGLYEKMIRDLARLNLRPYGLLFSGIALGIFLGGTFFTLLFASYRDVTVVFLMGLLLASIRTVLRGRLRLNPARLLFFIAGLLIALLFAGEPLGLAVKSSPVNWFTLAVGGALSSAAMLIPGIPGSAVLILLGIYDDLLLYIKGLALFNLLIFGVGSLAGIFFFARVLDQLYSRYEAPTAYFFAGLIAGSARIFAFFLESKADSFLLNGFLLIWSFQDLQQRQRNL